MSHRSVRSTATDTAKPTLGAAFADVRRAIPKVDKDVSIGYAGLAAAAVELGHVDELRMFRNPAVIGDGTPFLPPVTEDVPLDLIETRTFGSRVTTSATGASPMTRTETPCCGRWSTPLPGKPDPD